METTEVVVKGTLKPDGTLELDEGPGLPPGRVRARLQTLEAPAEGEAMEGETPMDTLERSWADQRARGVAPRAVEEIDAQINKLRDECEERLEEIARLQSGEDPYTGQESSQAVPPPSS